MKRGRDNWLADLEAGNRYKLSGYSKRYKGTQKNQGGLNTSAVYNKKKEKLDSTYTGDKWTINNRFWGNSRKRKEKWEEKIKLKILDGINIMEHVKKEGSNYNRKVGNSDGTDVWSLPHSRNGIS